ncbi:MAG: RNA ligase family protein [Candidatus Obscuribacterales bacterium]|nr:RNA ligase family protein [Candidatus Obscuribacterales bacterium]
MSFDILQTDLSKLNSMTKYPSILTYHLLGERGLLQDAVQIPFEGRVIGAEKIDGTNCRLIFCPDQSALVGSREDLLWERRDLIGNPAMGIVDAVRQIVRAQFSKLSTKNSINVYYLEVFGKSIGAAAKNYTKEGKVSFRLFDVVSIENYDEILALPAEKIAHWRDNGGQKFVHADQLRQVASDAGFIPVPPLFDFDASSLPHELDATYELLMSQGLTQCKLDEAAEGIPEGIVVRAADRSSIAKIRREDYERTIRRAKVRS